MVTITELLDHVRTNWQEIMARHKDRGCAVTILYGERLVMVGAGNADAALDFLLHQNHECSWAILFPDNAQEVEDGGVLIHQPPSHSLVCLGKAGDPPMLATTGRDMATPAYIICNTIWDKWRRQVKWRVEG